jgi:hypothetical protein
MPKKATRMSHPMRRASCISNDRHRQLLLHLSFAIRQAFLLCHLVQCSALGASPVTVFFVQWPRSLIEAAAMGLAIGPICMRVRSPLPHRVPHWAIDALRPNQKNANRHKVAPQNLKTQIISCPFREIFPRLSLAVIRRFGVPHNAAQRF